MCKIIKVVQYIWNSPLLPAALKKRPKSVMGIATVLLSLWGLTSTDFETDAEGRITDPGQIFGAFAELGVSPNSVSRMQPSSPPPAAKPQSARWRTISEVTDGDTLRLENGEQVRLIGVDAPEASDNRKLREDIHKTGMPLSEGEMVHLGQAAAAFAREAGRGRRCWLSYERERTDQYGRTLAYVHFENGMVLNELLLSQGYAKVYLNFDFRHKQRFILLQTEARLAGRGLWGSGKQ
jgi:micrococcal nuclease